MEMNKLEWIDTPEDQSSGEYRVYDQNWDVTVLFDQILTSENGVFGRIKIKRIINALDEWLEIFYASVNPDIINKRFTWSLINDSHNFSQAQILRLLNIESIRTDFILDLFRIRCKKVINDFINMSKILKDLDLNLRSNHFNQATLVSLDFMIQKDLENLQVVLDKKLEKFSLR